MNAISNSIVDVLPQEVMLHIFHHLTPFQLALARLVCRQFDQLANDDSLFKQHCFMRGAAYPDKGWRSLYIQQVCQMKILYKSLPEPKVMVTPSRSTALKIYKNRVFGGDRSGNIRIMPLFEKEISEKKIHMSPISALTIAQDVLISASLDGIRILEPESLEELNRDIDSQKCKDCISISSEGTTLASLHTTRKHTSSPKMGEEKVLLWDLRTATVQKTIQIAQKNYCVEAPLILKGNYLALGLRGTLRRISVWDLRKPANKVHHVPLYPGALEMADGKIYAMGVRGLGAYDLQAKEQKTLKLAHVNGIKSFGPSLIATGWHGYLAVIDKDSFKVKQLKNVQGVSRYESECLDVQDGILAVGKSSSVVEIYDFNPK